MERPPRFGVVREAPGSVGSDSLSHGILVRTSMVIYDIPRMILQNIICSMNNRINKAFIVTEACVWDMISRDFEGPIFP